MSINLPITKKVAARLPVSICHLGEHQLLPSCQTQHLPQLLSVYLASTVSWSIQKTADISPATPLASLRLRRHLPRQNSL